MPQNFNLTQTGEEVQQILDTATPITDLQQEASSRQQADTTLQDNIDSEASARQGADTTLQGNIEAEAAARQQAIEGLAQQIALTLNNYYQKSETMSAQEIQTLVAETIASYYTKLQVNVLIQDFITASVDNLVNYYLKTETFTKDEVNTLIAAVKQFRYQSVPTLPTASADTMGIIYLVPSTNPKTKNVKDEYITTSTTNEQGVTIYDWEQIGSTSVDLSGYSTTEQMNQAIASAIATALTSYYTKSETMSTQQVNAAIEQAVNTALASYYTKTQTDAAISTALNTALTSYYTKTETNGLLDTIRQSITTETGARTEADAALRALIQQVSASLVNYYLKSETYSKTEVNALVAAIKQFQYQVVATLPETPGPDTMGIIYLVPSTNPKTQNVKDEFITVLDGSTYKWEQIGSTTVDLSGYSTTAEMNAAIASALASYYTKAQVDAMVQTINTAIAQKQDTISDLAVIRSGASAGATALQPAALTPYSTTEQMNAAIKAESDRAKAAEDANAQNITTLDGLVAFINKSFGKYDGQTVKTLTQAKEGKYVNVNGGETDASGYGISAPIALNAGDILLVPSAQAVPAAVSVIARLVDRTYQKVIVYTYTYQQTNPELYATATADYDPSLVYTAIYDTTGETPVLTGWALGGTVYQTLPATHEVSEQFYEPLMKQAVAAMPSTGYYIYLCPTPMTIVVSGYTATVSGGEALVVGWGIFKNIATNFIGAPGQAVIAQAFAQLLGEIEGLKAQLKNLGDVRAICVNSEDVPKVQNYPMIVYGDGAPSAPNVPAFIGQKYLDTANKKEYTAFSVTNSVSDWVLIN